jgi:ATP-dependent Clp protease ATP-binding subunit ClpC
VFEHFTEHARQVVVLAQDEARALKHDYIGTEHLLLGLLREENGLACRVLESFDVTVEEIRAQVARLVGTGERSDDGEIPFTPRAKKVLEIGARQAERIGDEYVDTEHILLGIVEEGEGVAARILVDFDVGAEELRDEIMRLKGWTGYVQPERERPIVRRGQDFRVLRPPTPVPLLAAAVGGAIFAAGLLVGWLIWG